jgi:hypothetical protein
MSLIQIWTTLAYRKLIYAIETDGCWNTRKNGAQVEPLEEGQGQDEVEVAQEACTPFATQET